MIPGDYRACAENGTTIEAGFKFRAGFFCEPFISRPRRLSDPLAGNGADNLPSAGAAPARDGEGHLIASSN